MFVYNLILGVSISFLSTLLYLIFTKNNENENYDKNEYYGIFGIIFIVSLLILMIFNKQSIDVVPVNNVKNFSPNNIISSKPPF